MPLEQIISSARQRYITCTNTKYINIHQTCLRFDDTVPPTRHKDFLLNCTQNQHKLHVKHVLLVVTCATLSLLCLGMELVTSHRTQWVGVGQPVTVQGLLLCGAFPDLLQTRGVPSGCISYSSRKG